MSITQQNRPACYCFAIENWVRWLGRYGTSRQVELCVTMPITQSEHMLLQKHFSKHAFLNLMQTAVRME